MSDLERFEAPDRFRNRVPDALQMLRERLPELNELPDEILQWNAGNLWEAAKCRKKCSGCTGYENCWRDGDGQGHWFKVSIVDGSLLIREVPCKQKLDYDDHQQQQRFLASTGMTEVDRLFTFDNFPKEQAAAHPEIYRSAQKFADDYPETAERSLYLYGPTGIGKTHLLKAVANLLNERGQSAVVIRADKVIDQVLATIRNGSDKDQILERYINAPVLLIDEFAQGKMTDHTLAIWLKILSARMEAGRPTWFTSNRVPTKIYERYYGQNADMDEDIDALRSRVYALGRAARMDGDDWRMNNLDDALGPKEV